MQNGSPGKRTGSERGHKREMIQGCIPQGRQRRSSSRSNFFTSFGPRFSRGLTISRHVRVWMCLLITVANYPSRSANLERKDLSLIIIIITQHELPLTRAGCEYHLAPQLQFASQILWETCSCAESDSKHTCSTRCERCVTLRSLWISSMISRRTT